MRKMEFQGILESKNSFKEYFILNDGILPLEWRVYINYSNCLDQVLDQLLYFFNNVIIRDDLSQLSREGLNYYKKTPQPLSVRIDNNIIENLRLIDKISRIDIDEILMSFDFFEKNEIPLIDLFIAIKRKVKIRRIDLLIEHSKSTFNRVVFSRFEEWTTRNEIELHITSKNDHPDDEWYSRPGREDLVDSDPLPYYESGSSYPILSGPLIYKRNFFFNPLVGNDLNHALGEETKITDLVYAVLKAKFHYYRIFSREIKNRKDNIYYSYFKWVADHCRLNKNFNFIPNILLKPYYHYYKALIKNENIRPCKQGLLIGKVSRVIPLLEIK